MLAALAYMLSGGIEQIFNKGMRVGDDKEDPSNRAMATSASVHVLVE